MKKDFCGIRNKTEQLETTESRNVGLKIEFTSIETEYH